MCNRAFDQNRYGNHEFHAGKAAFKAKMRQHWMEKHGNRGMHGHGRHGGRSGFPPVNVTEEDKLYQIQLFAAGYEKSDFKVDIVGDLLTVSVEKLSERTEERASHFSQSFQPGSFTRRFELNEKVDKNSITAAYVNGVLTLILPKLEGSETVRQQIEIA